jgi:hypothetical protein
MSDRKRLLLVGATTGYQTRVFAEAAERLDFDLVLATDRCHVLDDPWGDHALALRFEDPEGAAGTIAADARVDGIVAVGDRPAYIAALAAERMGIPSMWAGRDVWRVYAGARSDSCPTMRFFGWLDLSWFSPWDSVTLGGFREKPTMRSGGPNYRMFPGVRWGCEPAGEKLDEEYSARQR